ncbi:metallophosphoesterase [Microvirga sp. HBU67558]|uniref:metallophosphoesterase n=2 Tax=Microvirga TaxID=186650 RepID=UPI001B39713E|nr:metallophosphoesterase [Microvirga sp. HBU67558]MBQ0819799.1 metallophosphoesterase [Microvirga sp. HBU67558]
MKDVPRDQPAAQDPAQPPESPTSDASVVGGEPKLDDAAPPPVSEELPQNMSSLPSDTAPTPVMAQPLLQIVEVEDLNWQAVRKAANPASIRSNMRATVERMEALLDKVDGPGMLFDNDRTDPADKVIQVSDLDTGNPLWIIGDLHGDLLALEAALAAMRDPTLPSDGAQTRIVFLGDLFDDEGFGLEVLLRVFELIVDAPDRVCLIAGNHDEALSYDGVRFASSVTPSDFADFLNANLAHEWIERAGKMAVRLFARAPRALFFPDGLLVAHGGFPLADLHARLAETRDWNDPQCLSDFVWTRAHPKARKKLPNRFSRGSQFGYEDFAAFCSLSASLARPVTHMVRGHDHVEERYAAYPAYRAHPVLTTVALSRRLSRESFGPYERVPTMAQFVEGTLPRVYRLHIPADMIREVYPELAPGGPDSETIQEPH